MKKANTGLLRLAKWLQDNKLELAPHMTEAVLTTKRNGISKN